MTFGASPNGNFILKTHHHSGLSGPKWSTLARSYSGSKKIAKLWLNIHLSITDFSNLNLLKMKCTHKIFITSVFVMSDQIAHLCRTSKFTLKSESLLCFGYSCETFWSQCGFFHFTLMASIVLIWFISLYCDSRYDYCASIQKCILQGKT